MDILVNVIFYMSAIFCLDIIGSRAEKRRVAERNAWKRKAFDESVKAAGMRVQREIAIERIMKEEVRESKRTPVRKVCGIFGTPEAQPLLSDEEVARGRGHLISHLR